MRNYVLATILLLLLPACVAATDISALAAGRVSLDTPHSWQQVEERVSGRSRTLTFRIDGPAETNQKSRGSFITLTITTDIPHATTVRDYDLVSVDRENGKRVIGSWYDSSNWMTRIWSKDEKPFRVQLERFGISEGISVEFLMSIPYDIDHDPKWTTTLVDSFNETCATLKIDGITAFGKSRVVFDKIFYLKPLVFSN